MVKFSEENKVWGGGEFIYDASDFITETYAGYPPKARRNPSLRRKAAQNSG